MHLYFFLQLTWHFPGFWELSCVFFRGIALRRTCNLGPSMTWKLGITLQMESSCLLSLSPSQFGDETPPTHAHNNMYMYICHGIAKHLLNGEVVKFRFYRTSSHLFHPSSLVGVHYSGGEGIHLPARPVDRLRRDYFSPRPRSLSSFIPFIN